MKYQLCKLCWSQYTQSKHPTQAGTFGARQRTSHMCQETNRHWQIHHLWNVECKDFQEIMETLFKLMYFLVRHFSIQTITVSPLPLTLPMVSQLSYVFIEIESFSSSQFEVHLLKWKMSTLLLKDIKQILGDTRYFSGNWKQSVFAASFRIRYFGVPLLYWSHSLWALSSLSFLPEVIIFSHPNQYPKYFPTPWQLSHN